MKVTIKLKQERCMTIKIMRFALQSVAVSNCTPSEISRELCHHRKRAKKWHPLRPIISEITTAIRLRTLTSTNISPDITGIKEWGRFEAVHKRGFPVSRNIYTESPQSSSGIS